MEHKNTTKGLAMLPFGRAYRRLSVSLIALSAGSVLLKCLSPVLQRRLIDGAVGGDGRLALLAGVVMASVMVADFGLGIFIRWLDGLLAIRVRQRLKGGIFRHLLALPEEFLKSKGAGYFFNRVQSDSNEVCMFMVGNGVFIWSEFLKMAIAMAVTAKVDWRVALISLPFIAVQAAVCGGFRRRQYALSSEIHEVVASERHLMQEYLSRHSVVKTHSAAEAAGDRVDSGMRRWGGLFRSRLVNENWFRTFLQIPVWACKGVVAFIGFYRIAHGGMTVGELWELIALLSLLFAPARAIGGVFVQMQSALAAWGRLGELWGEQVECDGSRSDVSLKGDICFNNLCFRYLQEKPLLENVNFTVKGGSLVFLTGPNGCGKSTLLSLLLRLYKPLGGDVTIGGRSISEFPLKGLRSRIGYIGQSPEFIKGNLRENLLLGNNGRTDEEIMAAGRMAGCESLIASRGLGSAVEEEAGNFSGGEKLRLALARELLRDTDILLFDEPAAHLDSENRRAFYNLLQGLGSGKTVIAVVHNIPEGISVPIISLPLNN